MPRRLVLACAVVLGAFALRAHGLGDKSLWYDELRQVEVAQQPPARFQEALLAHAGRPLDYLVTRALLPAGRQEFWLRFPAAMWSVLAVAAARPAARRLFGPRAALPAMALLAAAPLGVQYGQEARPYALYALAALLGWLALERALDAPGNARVWAVFAATAAAGTLTHFFYVFVLAAQAAYGAGVLLATRPEARSRAAGRAAGFAGLGAGTLAGAATLLIAARPGQLVFFARQFLGALGAAPAAGELVGARGTVVHVSEAINGDFFLVGVLPHFGGGTGAALVVFNALVLAGLLALARCDRRRLALALLWAAGAPAGIILYLQYRQEFFALRYILFALPLYLMLAARGAAEAAGWAAQAARGRSVRVNALSASMAALLIPLLAWQAGAVRALYATPKDNWRRVGAFLEANTRPGDTLGAPDVQAFIRFYAPGQAATIVEANDLGPHEQALLNGERFWFVWSAYTLLPLAETKGWAEALPGVTFQLDPAIKVIYAHPGRTQAEMLAEAQGFVIPPP
jgi:uncharacterized membrane protein